VRKAAIAVAILIVVALAALYLAPRFYDFDRYRPLVAEWASDVLGRPVTIAGKMSLELLPSPHIALSDVHVANPPGAPVPELARIREVSAAVSFWPLLRGRIEVTSARLVEPVLVLDRPLEDFQHLSAGGVAAAKGQPPGTLQPASAAVERRIKIARVTVVEGTLAFRVEGRAETLEHVSLLISGDAVTAPLHAEGKFARGGLPLSMTLDLGRLGGAEVPLALVLGAQGLGSLEVSGTATSGGATSSFSGKLALKGEDLGALAQRAGIGPLPPMLAKPYRLGGDLSASASGATLDRLVLDLGDIHGTGSLSAKPGDPPALVLTLAVNSFDLDRYLAERAAQMPSGTASVPSAVSGPSGSRQDGPRFDLPAGLAATVDLAVDAVVWRQSVIRRFHVTAALGSGKLAITHAGALLPGGSDVGLSG